MPLLEGRFPRCPVVSGGRSLIFFIEPNFVTWDDGSVCCVGLLWMIVRGFRVQMMLYKDPVAGFYDCQDLWISLISFWFDFS